MLLALNPGLFRSVCFFRLLWMLYDMDAITMW